MVSCHMAESLSTPIMVDLSSYGTQECIQAYRWVHCSIYNAFIPKVNPIPFAVERYFSMHHQPTYSQADMSGILGWL